MSTHRKVITLRITREQHAAIRDQAAANKTSINSYLIDQLYSSGALSLSQPVAHVGHVATQCHELPNHRQSLDE